MTGQEEHQQRLETLGVLTAGVVHDFNNTLMSIMGFAQLALNRAKEDPLMEKYLLNILEAGSQATGLARQVLAFTRHRERDKKPLSLESLVKEASKLMRVTIPRNIEIITRFKCERSTISGDPIELHQLLLNLCTNAYQAIGDKNGVIEICLTNETLDDVKGDGKISKFVCLMVRDSGRGIPEEIRNRIFDPFFTTKSNGTGLGLAIALNIVKAHNGFMRVESSPGEGTTFWVFLPLLEREASSFTKIRHPRVSRGSGSILFVDDDPLISEVIPEFLRETGYSVRVGYDGREALEVLESSPHSFDLMITDNNMPGLRGADLIRAVKSLRSDLPIIVFTGLMDPHLETSMRRLGVKAVIRKPVPLNELARVIRKVLG